MNDNAVKIVEMGARDGLQSQPNEISTATKIELINRLSDCGLTSIEAGSFVSPKWVPQMADSAEVLASINRQPSVTYSALTPNLKGWQNALAADADEVAIFASASEGFSQKNLNCSVAASLERFQPVLEAALAANVPVRGYVSCILGCPYDGDVSHKNVIELTEKLLAMGCFEVSLGDTIGVGTAGRTKALLLSLAKSVSIDKLAMHFHDTYGQAIANLYASLEQGIRVFDASVGGLGGCPYAKGAKGNVATEDVVYLLEREGFEHGIDFIKLSETGVWINQQLGYQGSARAGQALLAAQ